MKSYASSETVHQVRASFTQQDLIILFSKSPAMKTISINDGTLPSECYPVIYMVRVGLGIG